MTSLPDSMDEPSAALPGDNRRSILSVAELTSRIKSVIESGFPFVWIRGEVSNLRVPASGHLYFTLKDDKSELRSVMWKGQAAWLGFEPRNGDAVLAHGRVTVYEVRGVYQLVCDTIQTACAGDLIDEDLVR